MNNKFDPERAMEIGSKFLAWTTKTGPCPISINDHIWFKRLWGLFETIAELEVERDAANVENNAYPKVVSSLNCAIDKIVHDGFALMYSINNAITYDNEEAAQKGNYGLPIHVVEEMRKFTQLLHDYYDAKIDGIDE
jgi:hypothetical protein